MFLKNRELRVQLAKPSKADDRITTPNVDILDQETIHDLEEAGKRLVKFTAIAVGATLIALKLADALSEIAVKKTKSADKE